jgi:hypothetical protein
MSSRQKRKQARLNGAKAAGTKSPAGIQKSSANSLKHGLTGKAIVLSNESQTQFDELHLTYVQEFEPQTGVEMDLVDQMVAAQWRLRRIWRLQTAALDLKMDQQEAEIAKTFHQIDQPTRTNVAFTAMANEEKALDLYLRYETAYTRMHQRAMNSLSKLRKEKLRNDPEPPSEPSGPSDPHVSTSVNVNCETTPPVEPNPEIDPIESAWQTTHPDAPHPSVTSQMYNKARVNPESCASRT